MPTTPDTSEPDPARVTEISTEIRGFLNDACDRALAAGQLRRSGYMPSSGGAPVRVLPYEMPPEELTARLAAIELDGDLPVVLDPARLARARDAWVVARAEWHYRTYGVDRRTSRALATHTDWPRFEAAALAALGADQAPRIKAIKVVRGLTSLGLREAHAVVEDYRAAYGFALPARAL